MSFPFFYINSYDPSLDRIVLNEETSRHIVQVLRMRNGEGINLTDGKGTLLTCSITSENKKHCEVSIEESVTTSPKEKKVSLGISLLKSSDRFEWFVEKATEIGVHEIIPLICERTERNKFRYERVEAVVISAMLQSQQTWLPNLHTATPFEQVVTNAHAASKLIAHCSTGDKQGISLQHSSEILLLIGPEGDFSEKEILLACSNNFTPVSLGSTRLRTETAGIVAAAVLLQ